ELPNARRGGHINGSVVPQASFRKHHFVRENIAFLELAIGIGILEPHYSMGLLLELLIGFVIRAGRVHYIQPPLFIERCINWPIHQRRPGDQLDFESIGHSECLTWKLELCRGNCQGGQQPTHGAEAGEKRFHRIETTNNTQKGSYTSWYSSSGRP